MCPSNAKQTGMSSGTALRSGGKRAAPKVRAKDLIGPVLGLSSDGQPGEKRLNRGQMTSIEHLYQSHPAIQAARSVLAGQLLSGGIALRRDGAIVDLKPAFKQHLEELWIPFARSVMDSFLKFGFAVVVYEEDDESLARQSVQRRAVVGGDGRPHAAQAKAAPNRTPLVPTVDTYDVAFIQAGRAGYRRKYLVYSTAPNNATRVDEEARVIVRQAPDVDGNVNSPMATIFDLGSFASSLTELALVAEVTNARPRVWTQVRCLLTCCDAASHFTLRCVCVPRNRCKRRATRAGSTHRLSSSTPSRGVWRLPRRAATTSSRLTTSPSRPS